MDHSVQESCNLGILIWITLYRDLGILETWNLWISALFTMYRDLGISESWNLRILASWDPVIHSKILRFQDSEIPRFQYPYTHKPESWNLGDSCDLGKGHNVQGSWNLRLLEWITLYRDLGMDHSVQGSWNLGTLGSRNGSQCTGILES